MEPWYHLSAQEVQPLNAEVFQERRMGPWYHLSAQEVQPVYAEFWMPNGGRLRTRCCLQDAWCGGSSLLLEGTIPSNEDHVTAR